MRRQAIARERERSSRIAMAVIGGVALACTGIGLVLHVFGAGLGFSDEHARITATAFLGLAVVELATMLVWGRVFPSTHD